MLIHTDCRHYRGSIPCIPNKQRGKECPSCEEYAPIAERILLIKLGAPGDVLRTTALLPALKRRYPQSEITWLTRSSAAALLDHLPEIDRVLLLEEEGCLPLQVEHFEAVLNLDNEEIACAIASQVSTDQIRGFCLDQQGRIVATNPAAQTWLEMALFDRIKRENTHTCQWHLRNICGLDPEVADPIRIDLRNEELQRAQARLERLGMGYHAPIAFHTGAGDRWVTKRWPRESFLELAMLLASHAKGKILLLGGPLEEEANRLLELERPDLFMNPGILPLRDFLALVSLCRMVVCVDTLALHVALAFQLPTVGLFGSTSASEIEGVGPFLKIVAPVDCTCCYLRECHKVPYCMEELTPQIVYQAILQTGWLNG